VYEALQNIVKKRPKVKVEYTVNGVGGFLTLDKELKPKVALHYEKYCFWAMEKYKKYFPDKPLPVITPHVFRHTFCTDMANAGLDIKSLQYVMGHSDANITMNVYTHARYDHAAEEMLKFARVADRKRSAAI
jgi:integrase